MRANRAGLDKSQKSQAQRKKDQVEQVRCHVCKFLIIVAWCYPAQQDSLATSLAKP